MDILSTLNERQQEAVKCVNGPLLILAGAGSGKTRTIIHRIAYILEERYARPYEILALTFTNKAAGEMRDRIDSMGIPFTRDIWMGTFHSICARILRMDGDKLGFEPGFSIYDDSDTKRLVKTIMKDMDISTQEFPIDGVRNSISLLKNNMETCDDYAEEHLDFDNGYTEAIIAKVYKEYQKRLLAQNAMDFDDLLLNVNLLFANHPDVLQRYKNRFKYILVDEYQDTNLSQYAIVSRLAEDHKNICVCGDDDQSIYGWRGADIRNILEFEVDFEDAKIIRLEQNYRCTKNILNAANGVIEFNAQRKGKTLFTDNEEGDLIQYSNVYSDYEEASLIAREIFVLNEYKGVCYNDMAILYRTNAQSRILEEALMKRQIPYQIVGGTKFYDRMEIKDIISYLKLIINPKDDVALMRIINTPKRGIGAVSVDKIKEYAFIKEWSMLDVILNIEDNVVFKGAAKAKLIEFRDTMNEIINFAGNGNDLTDIVINTIKASGYEDMLKEDKIDNSMNRLQNLDELVNAASEFENNDEKGDLTAFLENAALVSAVDTYEDNDEKALLMTLHNAKGLEFDYVFIPGMEEGLFPSARASMEDEQVEEERRLCYVGITRAKKKLYLSSSQTRRVYGRNELREPSRFLKEIPRELIEGMEKVESEEKKRSNEKRYVNKLYNPYEYANPKVAEVKFDTFDESDNDSFNPGDKVKHKLWGEGTVISAENSGGDVKLTAAFPGKGIKTIMAGVAGIKKV